MKNYSCVQVLKVFSKRFPKHLSEKAAHVSLIKVLLLSADFKA